MKKIILSFTLLCLAMTAYTTVILVPTDQAFVPNFIGATDTVIVEEGATPVDFGGISCFGTLINFGTFNANSGAPAIQNGGQIINYGSMSFPGAPNIFVGGQLINIGVFSFPGTLILEPGEGFINTATGMITGIVNASASTTPEAINCGAISDPVGTFSTNIPVGTPCDDLDTETLDDVITTQGDCASCAGVLLAPVPAMGEWGLMILSLVLLSFGILAIRQRRIKLT